MDQLDMLSNLPTSVIQKILSYLPIEQAVTTSILSTDWRYKWVRLPCLVFDDQSGYDIKSVVDHVLLLHRGPIETFKLSTLDDPADSEDIDKWIAHLSRKKIKEFVLVNVKWQFEPYDIFSCIFSYKDLTHLELHNCNLLKPPTKFKGFRMLKSLYLQRVDVSGEVLERLIACCPRLERIILCHLKGSTFCSGKLLRHILQLPRIERLTLKGSYLECAVGILTKKLPKSCLSLKYVSISIRLINSEEILSAIHLMRSAPALQELEIMFRKGKVSNDAEVTYCLSGKQNWEFNQLQRLKVTGFSGVKAEVDFIEFLLLTSPALQELETSFGQDMKGVDFSWLDDNQKTPAFTQLRVVKVTNFSGVKAEIDFIRFLLSNTSLSSQRLEKVVLQPASTTVSWELLKVLLAFKHDTLHADLKLLDPSSLVQESDDSSSDSSNLDVGSSNSDSDNDVDEFIDDVL